MTGEFRRGRPCRMSGRIQSIGSLLVPRLIPPRRVSFGEEEREVVELAEVVSRVEVVPEPIGEVISSEEKEG